MKYVIIGAGVSGVCCAKELLQRIPDADVTLIAATDTLQSVENVERVTRTIERFEVVERPLSSLRSPNLHLLQGRAVALDPSRRVLSLDGGISLPYDSLCIATGAGPRQPFPDCPNVFAVRDAFSVRAAAASLAHARRALVVGNGAIAMELVGALAFPPSGPAAAAGGACAPRGSPEVLWPVRHANVGDAFFDADAAAFLLRALQARAATAGVDFAVAEAAAAGGAAAWASADGAAAEQVKVGAVGAGGKRGALAAAAAAAAAAERGAAAGPSWLGELAAATARPAGDDVAPARPRSVRVLLGCEVEALMAGPGGGGGVGGGGGGGVGDRGGDGGWPLFAALSGGGRAGADVAVVAAGVAPCTDWLRGSGVALAPDGGVLVDKRMASSCPGVFAAGDVATAGWDTAMGPDGGGATSHWFQMRLWAQARAMGAAAGRAMAGAPADEAAGFSFELFSHCSSFFGVPCCLLGRYNGQGLDSVPAADCVHYTREEPPDASGGGAFARVLLVRGRLVGAVLLGDLERAEALENLILNGLDVGALAPALLDADVDLDDYFD